MSKVRADRYTNRADDGAPTFSQGVNVVGSGVSIGIGASVYSPANNKLVLGTANSERVSIGTDGSITASDRLGIQGAPASNYGLKVNAPGSGGHIQLAWNGTANAYLNSDSSGKIYFESTDSMILKTGNAERVTIDTSGNMTLNTGNLVIGTAGKGIDFSATTDGSGTMTSELLDDYEEGTFTPTLTQGVTNPTYNTTWTKGHYTKIGNIVRVHLRLFLTGGTTTQNQARIGGLPFTCLDTDSQYVTCTHYVNLSTDSGTVMKPLVMPGSTSIYFYYQTNTTVAAILGANCGNAFDILLQAVYRV